MMPTHVKPIETASTTVGHGKRMADAKEDERELLMGYTMCCAALPNNAARVREL